MIIDVVELLKIVSVDYKGVNDQLTRSQSFCKKSFDNITLIIAGNCVGLPWLGTFDLTRSQLNKVRVLNVSSVTNKQDLCKLTPKLHN